MAAKSRAKRSANAVTDVASSVRDNAYVQRLVEDEQLREDIRDAFDSAKVVYERITDGYGPTAPIEDKKTQREMRNALDSLRDANDRLQGRKQRSTLLRLLVLALLGAILAVVLSEDLRKTVLDALFGSEEEFEYSSTTAPSPSPATSGASSA